MTEETRRAETRKRAYHHGDLREALLASVLEIARDSGVASVTMRRVARMTGVSESAAYHHFNGKPDLLAAGAQRVFGRFADALERGLTAHVDRGEDPAIGLSEGYVTFALDEPGSYQLIFGRHVVEAGLDTRDEVRAAGGRTVEIALSGLAKSLEMRNKTVSAEEVFPMVRAVLHGVVSLANEDELEVDMSADRVVALAARTVDTLLNGLE